MFHKYASIKNIYKRAQDTGKIRKGVYSTKEFKQLEQCQWVFTEKINGTNISFRYDGADTVEVCGRTEKSQIPEHLLAYLETLLDVKALKNVFGSTPVSLFGEGYGHKIQKGGHYTGWSSKEVGFVLFDINCRGIWLDEVTVWAAAAELRLYRVPIIHRGPLLSGLAIVERGLESVFSSEPGRFAEGVVGVPEGMLLTRERNRIQVKIKHKDFFLEGNKND